MKEGATKGDGRNELKALRRGTLQVATGSGNVEGQAACCGAALLVAGVA